MYGSSDGTQPAPPHYKKYDQMSVLTALDGESSLTVELLQECAFFPAALFLFICLLLLNAPTDASPRAASIWVVLDVLRVRLGLPDVVARVHAGLGRGPRQEAVRVGGVPGGTLAEEASFVPAPRATETRRSCGASSSRPCGPRRSSPSGRRSPARRPGSA